MINKTERINKAVAFLKGNQIIKFQKDIMNAMEADKSTVSQALLGNEKYLTENFIRRFADVFPCINAEWLLTGDGEMLKTTPAADSTQCTSLSPMTPSYAIPIYNLDAVAGMHTPNDVVDASAYIDRWIQFPGAREGDVAFPVSNDSMIPKYLPGSLLQVRKVERWQEYFGYGSSFVIFLTDGRRVLKEIQRSEEDPTTKVLCVSCNAKYPPEELPKSLIRDVYKVIKSLSDEGF